MPPKTKIVSGKQDGVAKMPVSSTGQTQSKSYDDFLKHHIRKKEDTDIEITNTRVGDKVLGIFGGSFHIPDEYYINFLEKYYYPEIFIKEKDEYLTEKQLEKGPILVDVDMRFSLDLETRLYTNDHITDLVYGYLGVFKEIYQFDDTTRFPVYVFEKKTIRHEKEKDLTKDGVHIIFGIMANRQVQTAVRKKIIDYLKNKSDLWTELKSKMLEKWTWDDVFDEGISKGGTNWQLLGSKKPGYEAYKLSRVFDIGYSSDDNDYITDEIKLSEFNFPENFAKMSARYSQHIDPFLRSDFVSKVSLDSCAKIKNSSSNTLISLANAKTKMMSSSTLSDIFSIRDHDELKLYVESWLETLLPAEYNLKEAYNYTMCLPYTYYENGSYDKWVRVGWALRNIDDRLFIVWVLFSSQASSFTFSGIRDLYDKWNKFDMANPNGLTKRSLMHWAKQDAYDKYKKILDESVDQKIDNTLDSVMINAALDPGSKNMGCGDYDIATVLHQMYKDQFVCVSVKKGVWYAYKENRWKLSDDGTELRNAISEELRMAYMKKAHQIMDAQSRLQEGDEMATKLEARCKRVLDIYSKLGDTRPKDNIMKEAKELFYDGQFFDMVDTNPYIFVFKNGVWDFKEKIFRNGKPEDYVSKTCGNIYKPLDNSHDCLRIQDEINDFMSKLYPDKELREYMWDHLASTLIGIAVTQTFHNYIGVGRNGKSVLVALMGLALGEYKHEVNIKLITCKDRPGVGGVTPEIVELKGVRYAVMQEPSKGEKINEGPMKMMTSGVDNLQGRVPFGVQTITFKPQFKLVVCANYLLRVETQDEGTWRRFRVVPHEALFTENPIADDPERPHQFLVDPTLETDKFPYWKEVFLSMLVQRALKTGGTLRECKKVMSASDEYRKGQDVIAEFIAAKIVQSKGDKLKKFTLNSVFADWHISNHGSKGPKPAEVHAYLDKRFGKGKTEYWPNLRLRTGLTETVAEDSDNEQDEDDEPEL